MKGVSGAEWRFSAPYRAFCSAIGMTTGEMLFRHNVLKMLLNKGRISLDLIELMEKWRHTGFNGFVGQRISPVTKPPWETWRGRLSEHLFPKEGLNKNVYQIIKLR